MLNFTEQTGCGAVMLVWSFPSDLNAAIFVKSIKRLPTRVYPSSRLHFDLFDLGASSSSGVDMFAAFCDATTPFIPTMLRHDELSLRSVYGVNIDYSAWPEM
jgi:hypothetical protein